MASMSETFDPYRKWLGIPPKDRPPHHYRLLGIPLFEDDSDVIENAADRQMAHVRSFQSGKNSEHSQRLLNELAAAKVCLLNPQRKQQYDLQLRERREAEKRDAAADAPPLAGPPPAPPPKTGMAPVPVAVAVEEPVPFAGGVPTSSTPEIRSRGRRVRRRKNMLPMAIILLSVAALIAIAIVVLKRDKNEKSNSYRAFGARAISMSSGID